MPPPLRKSDSAVMKMLMRRFPTLKKNLELLEGVEDEDEHNHAQGHGHEHGENTRGSETGVNSKEAGHRKVTIEISSATRIGDKS